MQSRLVRLDETATRFFDILSEIIFTNPFGVERAAVERLAIKGTAILKPRRGEHHFMALIPLLDAELGRLRAAGVHTLDDVLEEQRAGLRHAFLFRVYHRHVADFDTLIGAQLEQPHQAVEASFADDAMRELCSVGLRPEESVHYFALFYQIRRAYYFIARALIGESASMRRLREALWNNVFSYDVRLYDAVLWSRMEDFSTLLLGETGTGKGSACAAMGRSSYIPFDQRRRRFVASFTDAFIATNLSQFSESLIESELFGHRKGAFTGAVDDHRGLFARCQEYGTLFLDEIGDVPASVQLKLLTVLQERVFTPVGSHQQQRFSGRVIAATNRPIEALRSSGRFRDDFFYRLCSDMITVPALRVRIAESPGELEALVRLLIERMTGADADNLVDMVLTSLRRDLPDAYAWPGNVRELEQAVRRVLLTQRYEGEVSVGADESVALATQFREGTLSATELTARYCKLLYARHGTYEEVARRVGLDRRTVRKYVVT